jgi:hypothetical protein
MNDKVFTSFISEPPRTPEDLVRLLDEATARVRAHHAVDVRWTTPRVITTSMLVEAVVVGHMRAWAQPPKAAWADPIVCEWANYVGTCFKDDLDKPQTLLTLIPALTAWLRDFPGYTRVAARYFDMEAAEQNVSAYLLEGS